MRTDDIKNYTYDGNYGGDAFGVGQGMIWNYGKELWCNLEGQYMHFVAELSHLSASSYEMSICSLGIMGTRYVHSQSV